MKNAMKDWITNIVAILLWGISTYAYFFTDKEMKFLVYIGVMMLGFSFLFIDSKQIRALIIKFVNKRIES
jgi:hypothetical protein